MRLSCAKVKGESFVARHDVDLASAEVWSFWSIQVLRCWHSAYQLSARPAELTWLQVWSQDKCPFYLDMVILVISAERWWRPLPSAKCRNPVSVLEAHHAGESINCTTLCPDDKIYSWSWHCWKVSLDVASAGVLIYSLWKPHSRPSQHGVSRERNLGQVRESHAPCLKFSTPSPRPKQMPRQILGSRHGNPLVRFQSGHLSQNMLEFGLTLKTVR